MANYATDLGVGTTDKNKPDARGSMHNAQAPAVTLMRDVYGGTRRMRECGEIYLPKWPREDLQEYRARLACAVLFNALKHTTHGMAGMILRVNPTLSKDVPKPIVDAWENIDNQGSHGVLFTASVLVDAILDGHSHVFVDMAKAPKAKNLKEERAAGHRPYWRKIRKQEVIRFATEVINGQTTLTRFAFMECVTVPDGAYGDKQVTRIREYRRSPDGKAPVAFEVYEKTKDKNGAESWGVVDYGNLNPLTEIPLATVYADPNHGFMVSEPPLQDLAYENVLHYQTRSDRQTTLHIAGVPIPVFIGMQEQKKKVSSSHGINLPLNGDAKYLEPAGAALDASRQELLDIEQRMAALGLAMLQRQTRAAETAEAKSIDKSEQDSALAMIAASLQDCLETAAGFHAKWIKAEMGGSINVSQDFEGYTLDPATVQMYLTLVREEIITIETMWKILVEGNALPEDFDAKKEKIQLEMESAKRLAAIEKAGLPAPGDPNADPKNPKPDDKDPKPEIK